MKKWILVKDKLPERFTFVFATCKSLIDNRENWIIESIYVPNTGVYSDWGNIPMLNDGEAEVIAWMKRDFPIPYSKDYKFEENVRSHSEKDIYNGCISLMNDLLNKFAHYLDFIGVDPKELSKEEQFCINYYPTEIVQTLFLNQTDHSGGASTRKKCRELGINTDKSLQFDLKDYLNN